VLCSGARRSLFGYVDVSFNWSTVVSTSASLLSNDVCVFMIAYSCSANYGFVVAFDLVFLCSCSSSIFPLSSMTAILPTRSAITSFIWIILSSASLLISAWSSMSYWSYVISFACSSCFFCISWICSFYFRRMSRAVSSMLPTFFSRALPAVYTLPMDASTFCFHVVSFRCWASRLPTYAA
jgi:hypothetical protein